MTNKLDSSYLNYSKHILSSVLLLTPFIFIYEIISFFKFYNQDYIIRNSADAILRDFFSFFTSINYYSIVLIVFILFAFINYKSYLKDYNINLTYYLLMIFESFLYSLLLIIMLNGIDFLFINPELKYSDIILGFYLCLGAGIWEEVLFRFILISILFKIFEYFIISSNLKFFIIVIISAFAFSMFHYIGHNPDVFSINSFFIRFIGGFVLGYIYIFRGLGIVALMHFFYDFIIVLILPFY